MPIWCMKSHHLCFAYFSDKPRNPLSMSMTLSVGSEMAEHWTMLCVWLSRHAVQKATWSKNMEIFSAFSGHFRHHKSNLYCSPSSLTALVTVVTWPSGFEFLDLLDPFSMSLSLLMANLWTGHWCNHGYWPKIPLCLTSWEFLVIWLSLIRRTILGFGDKSYRLTGQE